MECNKEVLQNCEQYLTKLDRLRYPKFCCSILKATDAGPGVGVTNTEIRFRDTEIARIRASDRVNPLRTNAPESRPSSYYQCARMRPNIVGCV